MKGDIEYELLLESDSNRLSIASKQSNEPNSFSTEFKKFTVEYSQNDFLAQKQYKIFVWTSNKDFLKKLFPKRTIVQKVQIKNTQYNVTFSIYTSSTPTLIDCVLFLLTKIEDLKEIQTLNQKYKYVWTQALISSIHHPDFSQICEKLGVKYFNKTQDLFQAICEDDLSLYKLLKQVFKKIDRENKGNIEFAQLFNAVQQIDSNMSSENILAAIGRIDVNNDGKVSFEEFCFWWRKGRQGLLSFSDTVLKLAKQISFQVPETRGLLRNMTKNRVSVDKKIVKKEVIVKVGNDTNFHTKLVK